MNTHKRKCRNCDHFRESLFCGYISSHCEVFGSLDMDQSERNPDTAGETCPKFTTKRPPSAHPDIDRQVDRILRRVKVWRR